MICGCATLLAECLRLSVKVVNELCRGSASASGQNDPAARHSLALTKKMDTESRRHSARQGGKAANVHHGLRYGPQRFQCALRSRDCSSRFFSAFVPLELAYSSQSHLGSATFRACM